MDRNKMNIIKTSFLDLCVECKEIGNDLLITVSGGTRPHIGCTVISIPRLSLSGDGKKSCTSCVWNLTGHKDEDVLRRLAEAYCKSTGKLVVCSGGIHVEDIASSQIKELISKVDEFIQVEVIAKQDHRSAESLRGY